MQAEIYRRMTPERRFELACEMSDNLRQLVADGVRGRHPDYTEEQVKMAVFRVGLGMSCFAKSIPGLISRYDLLASRERQRPE